MSAVRDPRLHGGPAPAGGAMSAVRDPTLDAWRGLTMVLMVLVNLPGSWSLGWDVLYHAPWHGLTVADLVFPWFLVIVGLSAALALDPARPARPARILTRALALIAIGVALGWLLRPSLAWDDLRWAGVLQRIALVWLACVAVVRAGQGPGLAAGLAAVLLLGHALLLLLVRAPGEPAPSLEAGMGISAWVDRLLVPGRLYRESWDPEGALSTLPAIATGLIGVAAMQALTLRRAGTATPALWGQAFWGLALLLSGVALTPVLPLNKALWTASFALVTAGSGLLLWAAMRAAWPHLGGHGIARWLAQAGQCALTLYVLHMLLIALLLVRLGDGTRLWDRLFTLLCDVTGLPPAPASLLFAVLACALVCAPLPALQRRGWLIRA